MLSDDERREVAERLRGLTSNVYGLRKSYESEGFSIFCDDQADYYQICKAVCGFLPPEHMHPCDYAELHTRLSDLIDPDCDEGRYEGVHTARPVDRDALLELADELEEDACWEVQSPGVDNYAWMLKDVCDRIREAIGVKYEDD